MHLALAAGASAGVPRGVVYEELTRDGLRDPEEPGIGGVRVSNGYDVVQTATDGSYGLDVADEFIVLITKLAGYATPVNRCMLPRFYSIRHPNGSPPESRYSGISPTGLLAKSIDFPLLRRNEPTAFDHLPFADTQPQTIIELAFIRYDVITEVIGTDAAFGMTLRDVLFDDLSLFPRYNALAAQLGIPWYNVPVNRFDGGPNFQVDYAIGKRLFQPMARVLRADPFANALFVANPDAKKSWVEEQPSSHLFGADLPDDLTPGVYTVTVYAGDEFGRSRHAHKVLEIVEGLSGSGRASITLGSKST